jgi:diguanylate cyclase (GGDEF)-like protein
VCFIDLDGFKQVNDRLGHAAGDTLLVGVAHHLQHMLRSEDTLARLGGDEFVVLLSDIASPEECMLILDRVLQAITRPVQVEQEAISVTASIGVSLYPTDNSDADALLRHADQAMYLAKEAGKNRYHLFDPKRTGKCRSTGASSTPSSRRCTTTSWCCTTSPRCICARASWWAWKRAALAASGAGPVVAGPLPARRGWQPAGTAGGRMGAAHGTQTGRLLGARRP